MSSDKVLVDIDNRGLATVTLNNPSKHNAFDDDIIAKLTEVFTFVANNQQVRVMVLAANGKSFSAGGDLNWMKRMANYSYDENLEDATKLATMLNTLSTLPKPTIARVQGSAYGGGVGLVSCCDMAVATNSATFCLSEVKLGLIPATIGPYVIAAIGQRAARRYFTTAEVFSAETAKQLGLVSEAVVEHELDQTTQQLVNALLNNGPNAVSAAKQLIFDVADKDISPSVIADTSARIAAIRTSPEGQEGLKAFLEKHPPSWINAEQTGNNNV